MDIEPTRLHAKCRAINTANEYARDVVYPQLAEFFRPFVGQKIIKADGTLLKKITDAMPAFPCSNALRVFRHQSDYSLAFIVKTCVSSPARAGADYQIASYHETVVQIGAFNPHDGATLADIYRPPTGLRSDYTPEWVEAARETYRQAKRAADDARNALGDFGEHDI